MRSRYSAHVRGNTSHLIETTLPEQREELNAKDLQVWVTGTRWKTLRILAKSPPSESSDRGWVEFEALYEQGSKHYLHRERSQFVRREAAWYFDMHPKAEKWIANHGSHLLGRNSACPCGSGRKLKKCCALV